MIYDATKYKLIIRKHSQICILTHILENKIIKLYTKVDLKTGAKEFTSKGSYLFSLEILSIDPIIELSAKQNISFNY